MKKSVIIVTGLGLPLLLTATVALAGNPECEYGFDSKFRAKYSLPTTLNLTSEQSSQIQGLQEARPQAQTPFPQQNRPSSGPDGQGACWQPTYLNLTEEQAKALEALQHAYMTEAAPLLRKHISVRLELRHLIRDANVQPKILFDRQKKISELQVKLGNLAFSCQMKARAIFTKEQLERLPEDCLLRMSAGC
jgi:Spy/CpxP family protein refolding chaperone